jgi:ribonucleotide monophosphatase NagD (HAD superfamily)
MRGILVRTGKFREEALEAALIKPAAVINSVGDIGTIL